MNTATPSRPDWSTRERDACDTLGEALARQGYVIWRPKAGEWAVMDPLHIGEYRTVKSLSQYRPPEEWWSRLWCDCARYETADGACVHKAAVWHEIKKPSPWRMYHEGY